VRIRQSRADEGLKNRDIRLRTLADSPDAFHSTVESTLARPDAYWRDLAVASAQAEDRVLYVAEVDGCWDGVAGGVLEVDGSVVEVVSVWVDPSCRGRGVGAAMITSVLDWGRERGASGAQLWVHDANDTAIRLYVRLGFTMTDQCQAFGVHLERTRCLMRLTFGSTAASSEALI
jgi:GNAT superfamily N-acetyltransferase